MKKKSTSDMFLTFSLAFMLIISMAMILAFPTMWLWNGVLVDAVDGINQITFFQALGLNLLFSILFKSNNIKSNNG